MTSNGTIEERARELVVEMRQWSRDQASLWQQLPYLALRADGVDGYSDARAVCYAEGWWRITHHTSRGQYVLCSVDCATGELANQYASRAQEKLVLARDEDILPLLLKTTELDAQRIIAALVEQAGRPTPPSLAGANPGWPADQADLEARLGLAADRPYVRPPWQAMVPLNGS